MWDLKTDVLCDVGALGIPWPKGIVPAWAATWLKDYGMTVDMRSEHPRTLTCDGMATATLRVCHLMNLFNPMRHQVDLRKVEVGIQLLGNIYLVEWACLSSASLYIIKSLGPEHSLIWLLPGWEVPCSISSGVSCLSRSGGGAQVHLRPQPVMARRDCGWVMAMLFSRLASRLLSTDFRPMEKILR